MVKSAPPLRARHRSRTGVLCALVTALVLCLACIGSSGCTNASASSSSLSSSENSIHNKYEIAAPLKVTIEVSSPAESPGIYEHTTISLAEGASVLDAIEATGLNVSLMSDNAHGLFVNAISNVENKGNYGWIYKVNGEMPGKAADSYELHDGDFVEWIYVSV